MLTISWNDANAGTGATSGTWYDRIVIQNLSTGATLLDATSYYNAGTIPAGGATARSYQYTLPNGDPGVGDLQVTMHGRRLQLRLRVQDGGQPRGGRGQQRGQYDSHFHPGCVSRPAGDGPDGDADESGERQHADRLLER